MRQRRSDPMGLRGGGHFENMGPYELPRWRGVKLIVVCVRILRDASGVPAGTDDRRGISRLEISATRALLSWRC